MAATEQRTSLAEQVGGDLQLAAFGLELHRSCALGLRAASPPYRCEAWQLQDNVSHLLKINPFLYIQNALAPALWRAPTSAQGDRLSH